MKIIKKSFTNIEGFTTKLCIIHFIAKACTFTHEFFMGGTRVQDQDFDKIAFRRSLYGVHIEGQRLLFFVAKAAAQIEDCELVNGKSYLY